MGLGDVVVIREKAKQGGGDVSEHDYTKNLPSNVGRAFDPVVFLWLWIDTLYSSMFTSMQLVGYMKVILISKQHQHPKIAQT